MNSEQTRRNLISIVMPAFNEEENLPRAFKEVKEVFSYIPEYDYEVLIIDNDSTDRTGEICTSICTQNQNWKYIKFSKNFTGEMSMGAGLSYSKGDAVIILFSDLQDPPELILEFVRKWEEGYDVVCGIINKRSDDVWWKTIGAKLMYSVLNKFSDTKIPKNATDFRLMSRKVVDAFNKLDERNRYFRGLVHWVGFKTYFVPYDRRPRLQGKSNAPFFYLIDFTIRALTNFSIVPLRLFSWFGLIIMSFTIFFVIITTVQYIQGNTIPGLTTLIILLLLNLGFMSIGIGTLGEYIGRIYLETKRRPLWIVERTLNIEILDDKRFGG